MAPAARRPPPSAALGIFLLAAVAFGLAASFLAGPAQTFVATAPSASSAPGGILYFQIAAVVIFLGIIAWFVARLALTLRQGTLPVPVHTMFLLLTMFGVAIGFVILFHLFGGGPLAVSNGSANHSVGGTPPPPGGSGPPVSNFTGPAGVNLPGWIVYGGLGVTAIFVVVLLFPYLLAARRVPSTPSASRSPSPDEVRAALRKALADLDAPATLGANRRIIAAYAALLERFEERRPHGVDGPVETMTPRDIERVCVERLQVAPTTARELTDLFEEARYSQHVMGEPEVERAREALRKALVDLGRSPRLG